MPGTLQLPTTGTLPGLTEVTDINTANASMATAQQASAAPTTGSTGLSSTAGLLWHDTTANQLKIRNQADTAWIIVGSFDETNGGWIPYHEGATLPAILRNYTSIPVLSNDGTTPNTVIDCTAGVVADDTNVALMNMAAVNCNLAATGINGLDTGTLAASTWYKMYIIGKANGATPGLIASLASNAAPTFPATYTLKRYIGSFRTDGSAHVLPFKQFQDHFLWFPPPSLDINADTTLVAANKLYALTNCPNNVSVRVVVRVSFTNTGAGSQAVVRSPNELGAVPAAPQLYNIQDPVANQASLEELTIRTNTAQQVAAWASAASNNTISLLTIGWYDDLGRNS